MLCRARAQAASDLDLHRQFLTLRQQGGGEAAPEPAPPASGSPSSGRPGQHAHRPGCGGGVLPRLRGWLDGACDAAAARLLPFLGGLWVQPAVLLLGAAAAWEVAGLLVPAREC